jgi:multicomponent Na+:H+ antiporter subunit E
MNYFTVNLILALLWASLQTFSPVDFAFGFVLGYISIIISRRWLGKDAYRYIFRTPLFVKFFFYYCNEVVTSTLHVTRLILRDESTLKPGIIALPLDTKTELELVLFHNLLVIIPGTMGVAVSENRDILYIHVIDVPDPDKMRESIKNGLERRLLEVMR